MLAIFYAVLGLLGWSMYRSWRKRRWISLSVRSCALAVLVVYPGFSWGILPGSSIYWDLRQTQELTGRSFLLGKPKLSYNGERAFNGDGYSIEVYEISQSVAVALEHPKSDFFQLFPSQVSIRGHWQRVTWQKTPTHPNEALYFEFMSIDLGKVGRNPNDPEDLAAELLSEEGNYYAYNYFMHAEYPGNVDLFILSPKRRLLVIANHNT